MALFINVEVDASVAKNDALAKKLAEVCPVNIFTAREGAALKIEKDNLDECVLCELCLNAAPPRTVRVKKLYGEQEVLERRE